LKENRREKRGKLEERKSPSSVKTRKKHRAGLYDDRGRWAPREKDRITQGVGKKSIMAPQIKREKKKRLAQPPEKGLTNLPWKKTALEYRGLGGLRRV